MITDQDGVSVTVGVDVSWWLTPDVLMLGLTAITDQWWRYHYAWERARCPEWVDIGGEGGEG